MKGRGSSSFPVRHHCARASCLFSAAGVLWQEPSAGGDVAAVRVDPAVRAVCEAMCRHLLQSVILVRC